MSVGAAADPSAPPAKARGGVPAAFFRLSMLSEVRPPEEFPKAARHHRKAS